MSYHSVNEYNDVPEHVVDEMNRLHFTNEGISMGADWPPEPRFCISCNRKIDPSWDWCPSPCDTD